jgi:hypothetical protein
LTGKELLVNQHSYYNNFNKSLFPLGNKWSFTNHH